MVLNLGFQETICAKGRDGILCGECMEGYSQDVHSVECMKDEECNGAPLLMSFQVYYFIVCIYQNWWINLDYVNIKLIWSFLFAYYLCYTTKYNNQNDVNPISLSFGVAVIIVQLLDTTKLPMTDSDLFILTVAQWLNFE